MKKNANKGFSLVELIIVIAIMAVLIGVLAPQFIKQVEKSRESTDLQNVEEVKTAVETWVADHGDVTFTTITVTLASTGLTVSGATDIDDATKGVASYGVNTNTKLKSSKWVTDAGASASIVWEYSGSDYKWSKGSASATKATYFNLDGTNV